MVNMLKAPMEKVDNIQGQMSNVSRKMKTLRIKRNEECIQAKKCP
jgi:hypothetical protein